MTKKLIIFIFLSILVSMIFVSAQDMDYIPKSKGNEDTEFFCNGDTIKETENVKELFQVI